MRRRITSLINRGEVDSDRKVGRSLWLAFEHEIMHLETYLYMLLQSSKIRSPPGSTKPDFAKLAEEAESHIVPNQWFRVPSTKLQIGLYDPENDLGPDRYFGWDNEKPPRDVRIGVFEAQGRPISNGEFATYLQQIQSTAIPASWMKVSPRKTSSNGFHKDVVTNGSINAGKDFTGCPQSEWLTNISVRTVYGLVPLQHARHWPVMASYDELAAYAKWADGRIPTLEEARSIYSFVEATKQEIAEQVPSSLISAVNG